MKVNKLQIGLYKIEKQIVPNWLEKILKYSAVITNPFNRMDLLHFQ